MTILNELHQDHINLNKILAILRSKVGKLRAGNHPNFSLMADVIDYICNYADGYHHPREDNMYTFFQGRNGELDQLLADCEAEHARLKHTGMELSETIEGILHDAVIPMEEFTDKLEAFVNEQSAHLDLEEGRLFPMLQKVATDADWAELDRTLQKSDDPLFGQKQAAEYSSLYKEMLVDMQE